MFIAGSLMKGKNRRVVKLTAGFRQAQTLGRHRTL